MKSMQSPSLKVRWTNPASAPNSRSDALRTKIIRSRSIRSISRRPLVTIIGRLPQAIVAARKPLISISSREGYSRAGSLRGRRRRMPYSCSGRAGIRAARAALRYPDGMWLRIPFCISVAAGDVREHCGRSGSSLRFGGKCVGFGCRACHIETVFNDESGGLR